MKRWIFGFIGIIWFLFTFSSCVNSLEDRSLSSDKQYGSLVWNDDSGKSLSRALNVGNIKTARITVCGFGMEEVSSSAVITVSNGKGSAEVKNIPVGKNRIVTLTGYSDLGAKTNVDGAVLRAVLDISSGKNTLSEINWTTSRKGYVYNALLENAIDISSLSSDETKAIDKAIPNVDPANINLSLFASDFKIGFENLKESSAYILNTEKTLLRLSVSEVDGSTESEPCFCATAYYSDGTNADVSGDSGTVWTSSKTSVATVSKTESGGKVTLVSAGETVVSTSYTYGGITKIGAEQTITVKASGGTIDKLYLVPNSNWTQASATFEAYMWNGSKKSFVVMTKEGDKYVADCDHSVYTNVIFLRCNPSGTANSWENIWNRAAEQTIPDNKDTFTINDGQWGDKTSESDGGTGASGTWSLTGSYSGGTLTAAISSESVDPKISFSVADGTSFTSSISVKITAENCNLSYYTTDGSDPSTSSTRVSFDESVTLTLGSDISEGETLTVRAYGTDGVVSSSKKAIYSKIEASLTPTRLGAYYTKKQTSFSIWSPDSSDVTVTVKPVGGTEQTYTCAKGFSVDGDYPDSANIYGVTVEGDLNLAEYQFYVGKVAVRDPYGKMIKYDGNQQKSGTQASGTENGFSYTSYLGPTVNIVMNMEETEPLNGWAECPALENRNDAIVYEVHVGDFTSDSTWIGTESNRGKFPGMVESGTTYKSGSTTVTTGLDHLKELGVTHVQLLPMYDFATKHNTTLNDIYNWGYDPVNYNVPEDRYSTCPGDYVERIREVKEMINEFHKNGIRVIMDVVYNHTFSKDVFSGISGKYYTSTDLSGCGNSTNTGVSMVSRMIRDSLEYWADEYNIDGFRFDLIGIYHTSAVKKWGEYLNNTKFPERNLLMYGEPWNGYSNDPEEGAKIRMSAVSILGNVHVGVFNGKFRQSLKGANDTSKMGYIFNENEDDGTAYAANIAVGLKGSGISLDKNGCSDTSGTWTRFFTVTPDQSINYMFAHDNLCFWDKIKAAGSEKVSYGARIVKFGHGILLVSQGIPFIHAGDEFLRTKEKGAGSAMSHNSYMAGIETNSIDWSLKVTNKSVSDYHSELIALRKAHDGFRNRNGVGTTETSGNAVIYKVSDTDGTKLCVVVNPGANISSPVSGTTIFDINGASPSSSECEGTAVTIIKY